MQEVMTPIDIQVTFELPDWFAPTESMWWRDNGETITRDSPHEVALFETFPELTETCVDPQSKWVTLRIEVPDLADLKYTIQRKGRALAAFLKTLE